MGGCLCQPPCSFIPHLVPSEVHERLQISGMSKREYVALAARPRSASVQAATGFTKGSYTANPSILSNTYFQALLNDSWQVINTTGSPVEYTTGTLFMMPTDLNLRWQPDYKAIAEEFAEDNLLFLSEFASAWTKLILTDLRALWKTSVQTHFPTLSEA